MRPQLEVCVDSIQSIIAANEGGADRIELCSALAVGGLTPSIGLLERSKQLCPKLPIYAMIRPRSGDFNYSTDEILIMQNDIKIFKSYGVDGFVFGILRTDGSVDTDNCNILLETASPLPCTFHRAFDVTNDPNAALEQVIKLGFTCILTSGQSPNAVDGIKNISKLVELAKGRIGVMAGAGVNENNLDMILSESKVKQFHSSASISKMSQMNYHNPMVSMGVSTDDEYSLKVTSAEKVRKMIEIAEKYQ